MTPEAMLDGLLRMKNRRTAIGGWEDEFVGCLGQSRNRAASESRAFTISSRERKCLEKIWRAAKGIDND